MIHDPWVMTHDQGALVAPGIARETEAQDLAAHRRSCTNEPPAGLDPRAGELHRSDVVHPGESRNRLERQQQAQVGLLHLRARDVRAPQG